ncbi:hypothetical protein ACP4OV_002326 [Aristida adscensionis]
MQHQLDTDLPWRRLRPWLLYPPHVRDRWCINSGTDCFCSAVSDPKLAGRTSEIGGVDLNVGRSPGAMIHEPKHSSVHYPTVQMLWLARWLDQMYTCPRYMVPKSIGAVPMTPRSSANVSEAGSVNPSSRVLTNVSMKEETRITVSSTSPVLDDICLDSGASRHLVSVPFYPKQSFTFYPKQSLAHTYTDSGSTRSIEKAQTSADSVDFEIDSGSSFFAPGASLDEQVTLNDLGDQRNNESHSNSLAAVGSSAKATCVPSVHKRTDNGWQHHR